MVFFQWTDDMRVGNGLIDQDHLELVTLVNELYEAARAGKSESQIAITLQKLFTYTQEHFQREELLMEHIHYSEIAEHKEQHQKLIDQVLVLQNALSRGRGEVASSTAELLRYWLLHHIQRTDKKLATAIQLAGLPDL
ncbi:bacteriohemerythrin [Undibacterium sp. Ren11W]|uniref:bacteriohemerythrin n=1 Tax=Undibacterium sp. Ren11W TaxID=3413045 RepID=UPI003BF401DF